jgi:type I restriction enzyme S subunit
MNSTWPMTPLGELCNVQIGRTPPRATARYWGDDHPWLAISDMNQGKEIWSTREAITDAAVKELNCRLVLPDTVLLSFKLSIGKVGIARIPMYTNEAIAHLPIVDDRLHRDFLYWALRTSRLSDGADRAAMGATLNLAKLREIPIPLPPMAEQERIVAVLDAADRLVDTRRAALEMLVALRRSQFVKIFGDPEARDSGTWVTLKELVRADDAINYGVVQPGEHVPHGKPLIRVGNIRGGRVSHDSIKLIDPAIDSRYGRSKLRGDEILLSCVGTTGAVALASEQEAGWNIARAVARIPLSDEVSREYVASFLMMPFTQRYFQNELRTVSQPTLNIKQIKATPIKLPHKPQESEFASVVRRTDGLRERLEASWETLGMLTASLQHRAFAGEL